MGKFFDRIKDILGEDIPDDEKQDYTEYELNPKDKQILEMAMKESANLEKELAYDYIKRNTNNIKKVPNNRTAPTRARTNSINKNKELDRG